MTFGLNNIVQAKVKKGQEDKKIDLLSWRMGSSYNFASDSMSSRVDGVPTSSSGVKRIVIGSGVWWPVSINFFIASTLTPGS